MAQEQRFTAIIARSGTRVFIPVPFDPNATWGERQRHHVTGSVDGHTIRGSLASDGETFVLPLGAAWRRDSGLEPGAEVEVVLAPEGPQSAMLAPDIAAALDAAPEARAFFDSLATFYRNTYLRWIESAKLAETRSARVVEMIDLLKAGKKQR
jgi:hypothetical protein